MSPSPRRSRPARVRAKPRRNGERPWNIRRVRALFPSFFRGGNKILGVFDGASEVTVAAIVGGEPSVLTLGRDGRFTDSFVGYDHANVRLAAKHRAAGTMPSSVEILRAYGVANARVFADARMAPLKRLIMRDLRAMRLQPYDGWSEVVAAIPRHELDVFSANGTPFYTAKAFYYASDEPGQKALFGALGRDIEEWMRTGAVKELKRLGPLAFDAGDATDGARDNPGVRTEILGRRGRPRRNGRPLWTPGAVRRLVPALRDAKILRIYEGRGGSLVVVEQGNAYAAVAITDRGEWIIQCDYATAATAVLSARHMAEGTVPGLVQMLRAMGVPDPQAFAEARMAPVKQAIMRELRAMRLFPYQGWDEIVAAIKMSTDDEYMVFAEKGISPQTQKDLHDAMREEITRWMRTGAVKELKRLGPLAFDAGGAADGAADGTRRNPPQRRHRRV